MDALYQWCQLYSYLPNCLVRKQFAIPGVHYILKTSIEPIGDNKRLVILNTFGDKSRIILQFVLVQLSYNLGLLFYHLWFFTKLANHILVSGIIFATSNETKFALSHCFVDNNGVWHNHEAFVLFHVDVYQWASYVG